MTTKPFDIIGDMEDPIECAIDLTRAILMLSETMGTEEDRTTINRLCQVITEKLREVSDRRGELFHLLHPQRAHFEAVGWPGEEKAAA